MSTPPGQPESDPQAPVHLAATVILMRDAAAGLEVWLLRRVRGLAFAGGASVFPGGRVDPADFPADAVSPDDAVGRDDPHDDPHDPADGFDGSGVAARFGCSPAQVRASMTAAIRETFEETGVLLTRPAYDVGDAARWLQDQRRRVETHALTFTALLTSLGVAVDVELIRPWAHWITPAGEPRRYDTHFYVAALPAGATAYPETTEASAAGWITPAAALAEHGRGERPMLPPTLVTLSELTAFDCVAAVLAASAERSLVAIEPELEKAPDGLITAWLSDGRSFVLRAAGS